jgi:Domain of unknown function (DUF4136)
MIKLFVLSVLVLGASAGWSQEFKIEYDKNRDFTQYKTFRFGEGELLTPKDQRQITAEQVDIWVKSAVTRELELKGMQRVDSVADLVVSYAAGTLAKSDAGDVGPLGMTPGSTDRTYMKDYRMANVVIDLHDKRDIKVWRINATIEMIAENGEKIIGQVVQKGFRKYPKTAKKK